MKKFTSFDHNIIDGVAHIIFNRPEKRNIMIFAFWQEIRDFFGYILRMSEARVVVISSTGPHFTAGIDLQMLAKFSKISMQTEEARRRESLRRLVLELQESFNVIERAHIPVLVAVQGGCIGGGVHMISACDMRYCTKDAYFIVKETELGFVADLGALQRLPRLIPDGIARELCFTARPMPAEEALKYGLVNAVYDDQQQMLEAVTAKAKRIAELSPLAICGTKEMLNYGRDHSIEDSLNHVATWQSGMFLTADIEEYFTSFSEERQASYEGLKRDSILEVKGN